MGAPLPHPTGPRIKNPCRSWLLNAGLAGLGNAGVILKSKRDYEQETARFETERKQREANLEGAQQANQEFELHKARPGQNSAPEKGR